MGIFRYGTQRTTCWDAVTGLGTPNYEKLAKVVTALPGQARQTDVVVYMV
jgi:hypothetical protein